MNVKAQAVTVGDITAQPGTIAKGYIKVAEKFDATWYTLPVMIVNGADPGESLLITGGVHGNETSGPVAIIQEIPKLDPAQMKGTVICVPVANIEAFEIKRRENLIDCVDMNRASPGSLDKRLTHKRLYFIFNEILPKVKYLLDLHHSGDRIDVLPMAVTRKGARDEMLEFVMAEGLDIIWEGGIPEPGVIFRDAYDRGILTCSVEIGSVEWQRKVIRNILKYLRIIEGEPELPREYRLVTGSPHYSRHGGFWFPNVEMRDEVETGDVIGTLYDVFGDVIEEVRATHPGVVCSIRHYPETNPGNELVGYYEVKRTIKR
jgi:predicted deacylase